MSRQKDLDRIYEKIKDYHNRPPAPQCADDCPEGTMLVDGVCREIVTADDGFKVSPGQVVFFDKTGNLIDPNSVDVGKDEIMVGWDGRRHG